MFNLEATENFNVWLIIVRLLPTLETAIGWMKFGPMRRSWHEDSRIFGRHGGSVKLSRKHVFFILGMCLRFAGEKYLYLVWKTYLLIMEKAVGKVVSCCDCLVGYGVKVRMRNHGANVVSLNVRVFLGGYWQS